MSNVVWSVNARAMSSTATIARAPPSASSQAERVGADASDNGRCSVEGGFLMRERGPHRVLARSPPRVQAAVAPRHEQEAGDRHGHEDDEAEEDGEPHGPPPVAPE